MAVTINGTTGITSPGGDTSTSLSTGLLTVTGSTVPANGMYLPTTNTIAWATNSSEKLRLDASGNLGLGVTPSGWSGVTPAFDLGPTGGFFSVNNTFSATYNAYYNGTNYIYKTSRLASQYNQTSGQHQWFTAPSGTAGNAITFTQAMTLDASGNLLVGTTSANIARLSLQFTGSAGATGVYSLQSGVGGYCYSSNATLNSGIYYHVIFYDAGASHGSITSNGTNTAYNTNSDQRLKNDKGVATDTSVIDNTVVHEFEWKSNGRKAIGVFAQEAQNVNPDAVTPGQADDLNEDGTPIHPWGVDYSKYVPDLIVYCQQLRAEINELKAKVNA